MKQAEIETKPDQEQAAGIDTMSSEVADNSIDPADHTMAGENAITYFPVSEGKLITLYILSFGLYGVYWFYKNWSLLQPRIEKRIFPLMRAIFSIFFTHSLFKLIDQSAVTLERKHKFNANLLATLFVAAVVISNILDRVSVNSGVLNMLPDNTMIIISLIIFLLSAYPLAVVQATVNRLNNDILGYLNHRYSAWNYLLIIAGTLLWLMVLLGLLAGSMGLVPAQ
ncbi:MAG: hypothetical protein KJN89_01100 [Gammaproteobacteria bacterium]|nr:hypothetical protein [Gammaproteobacteria bacterium]NNJ48939.1 hypothetical protein [Gammaproteobacteria bacterium]